jgi:predicted Ser/Thr protein kinase
MRHTVDRLEKSAKVVKDAHEDYLTAKREYTVDKATKRQEYLDGPRLSRDDRDDKATLDTVAQLKEMDTKMVAHSYTRDLSNVLEKKLSALQTQAKLILAEYNIGSRI